MTPADNNRPIPPEPHHEWVKLGRKCVRFGQRSPLSDDEIIINASDPLRAMFMLAAILEALPQIVRGIDVLASYVPRILRRMEAPPAAHAESPDPVANGLLQSFGVRGFDRRIDECPTRGLDIRARKAINKAKEQGAVSLSDLTWDRLMDIRNCGETTTRTILAWVDEQRGIDHEQCRSPDGPEPAHPVSTEGTD